MPIFRARDKLVYFAHVPKCGGTSVEDGIQKCGVKIALKDAQFWSSPSRWYKTSPQHIQLKHLIKLFPEGFFDVSFAVVRDPVARFLSAFNHAQSAGRIDRDEDPLKFANNIRKSGDYLSSDHDNHFVPMERIIPTEARVFHLENGLLDLRDWLSSDFPKEFSSIRFSHRNKRVYNALPSNNLELQQELEELYSADYQKYYC